MSYLWGFILYRCQRSHLMKYQSAKFRVSSSTVITANVEKRIDIPEERRKVHSLKENVDIFSSMICSKVMLCTWKPFDTESVDSCSEYCQIRPAEMQHSTQMCEPVRNSRFVFLHNKIWGSKVTLSFFDAYFWDPVNIFPKHKENPLIHHVHMNGMWWWTTLWLIWNSATCLSCA